MFIDVKCLSLHIFEKDKTKRTFLKSAKNEFQIASERSI